MRVFSAAFETVNITAVQDLFSLLCSSTNGIRLHSVTLTQSTTTTVAYSDIAIFRIPVPVQGSGGSVLTPRPMQPSGSAASTVVHCNDTVVSTGTSQLLYAELFNDLNGFQFMPPPEDRPMFAPTTLCLIKLNTAPASTQNWSGSVFFEELF